MGLESVYTDWFFGAIMKAKDAEGRPICGGSIENGFVCGKPATWHVILATRSIARCDKHATDDQFISTVIARQPVNPKDAMKYVITS